MRLINSARAVGACSLLFASVSIPTLALAQTAGEVPAPERALYDENGVNVTTGQYRLPQDTFTVGSGVGSLKETRLYGRPTLQDARITLPNPYSTPTGWPLPVSTGNKTYNFVRNGSGFVAASDGATLSVVGGYYQLKLLDGTRYTFGQIEKASVHRDNRQTNYDAYAYLTLIEDPNGLKTNLAWQTTSYCPLGRPIQQEEMMCRLTPNISSGPAPEIWVTRLASVSTSAGYGINYAYAGASLPTTSTGGPTAAQISNWRRLVSAAGVNSQGGTGPLPSASYAFTTTSLSDGTVYTDDVTDGLGRVWHYTRQLGGGGSYDALRRPGSSSDNTRINFSGVALVTSVVRDGATWAYNFTNPTAATSKLIVTDPVGRVRTYESDIAVGLPKRIEDEYGRVTSYTYDDVGRVKTSTSPGQQVTSYEYDTKGNLTKTTVTAVGGATLSQSSTYGDYSCATAGICNRMATSTDQAGIVTNYTYDAANGEVTSAITQNVGGVNPSTQTRYSQVAGVWLPSSSWSCRTQANCEGTADAVKTVTTYNANLLPQAVTTGAGDGSLQATTSVTYTAAGDVSTVDGPLPGVSDTTRYYYDAARQPLGSVGPDPDGGGVLLRRANRIGYDAQGRATTFSLGTASDQGDAALANMAVLQVRTSTLDAAGRVLSSASSSGGTPYARTDYAYDAAGRSTCVAVRVRSAVLGAASDACVGGVDPDFGPDRVSVTQYSAPGVGNPAWVSITSAYGTDDAATETTLQTATGKIASVTDGNGNVTSYAYDGFGRSWRTCFQTASSSACAGAPSDYEQLGYDAAGRIASRRVRDGQVIGFSYDALGRGRFKDLPGGDPDVTYGYNLIGQVTSVTRPDVSHSFDYDALGRLTSEGQPFGSISYQYDLAGRRTRMTWWDGFYVEYDYLTTGEVAAIRENGATSGVGVLASYGYDQLGRRAGVARGNGTSSSYSYDSSERLSALSENLAGAGYDFTHGFGYNPAGQITSQTRSNDAYAWSGHYNVDRNYAVNGLNQVTAAGSTAVGYDARGNLTSSGNSSYTYWSENMLKSAPGVTLYYDALGRLDEYDTNISTRFVYDGDHIAAEVANPSGSIMRRYVFGSGSDEPLVWYEGAGASDRRWLHADERGSIVATTDASGNVIATNTYDEYGIPSGSGVGRFGYTGQAWLPDLGLSYYKARMYSPTLGRFIQADPIGYDDGLNWYSYVGGDPVNLTDPTGLSPDVASEDTIIVNGHVSYDSNITVNGNVNYLCILQGKIYSNGRCIDYFTALGQGALAGGVPPQGGGGGGGPSGKGDEELKKLVRYLNLRQCLDDVSKGSLDKTFSLDGLLAPIVGGLTGGMATLEQHEVRWKGWSRGGNPLVAFGKGLFSRGTLWGIATGTLYNQVTGGMDGYNKSSSCKRL